MLDQKVYPLLIFWETPRLFSMNSSFLLVLETCLRKGILPCLSCLFFSLFTITFFKFSIQFNSFYYFHRIVQPSSLSRTFSPSLTAASSHSPYAPHLLALATINLSVSTDLPILIISYKWNHIIYGLLWLASLPSIMFSKFTHVAYIHTSLLSMAAQQCMDTSPFLYISSVDRHLVCFPLVIKNDVARNIHIHICWIHVFNSLRYTPQSMSNGLYGKFMFNLLRNSQTVKNGGFEI